MFMPLISVIVPVYKVEPYLHRCVDSILDQTFKDFELILVDDGSPDNCPHICDEYAKKYKKIVVIHKENGGLSSARNTGLDYSFSHSNSKYISFIDSDDYVEKTFLEKLYKAIDGCELSLCYYKEIDANGAIKNNKINHYDCVVDKYGYWKLRSFGANGVSPCNKLYLTSLFAEIRYPVGKHHEDEFVIHRIIDRTTKIHIIPDELYCYCRREDSIMGTIHTDPSYDKTIILDIYYDRSTFYIDKNYDLFYANYYAMFNLLKSCYADDKTLFKPYLNKLRNLRKFTKKPKDKKVLIFTILPSIYVVLRSMHIMLKTR